MSIKKELEYKVEVKSFDLPQIIKNIESIATYYRSYQEIDHYYYQKDSNNKEKELENLLRLRFANNKCILGFKKYLHKDSFGLAVADEYETEISNPERFPHILKYFNIQHLITVQKERTQYTVDEREVSINIDKVKGLGIFIEIEELSSESTYNKVNSEMQLNQIIEQIGLKIPNKKFIGYPIMLLQKKGKI